MLQNWNIFENLFLQMRWNSTLLHLTSSSPMWAVGQNWLLANLGMTSNQEEQSNTQTRGLLFRGISAKQRERLTGLLWSSAMADVNSATGPGQLHTSAVWGLTCWTKTLPKGTSCPGDNVNDPCIYAVMEANDTLDHMNKSIANTTREVTFPPCLAIERLHLEV